MHVRLQKSADRGSANINREGCRCYNYMEMSEMGKMSQQREDSTEQEPQHPLQMGSPGA